MFDHVESEMDLLPPDLAAAEKAEWWNDDGELRGIKFELAGRRWIAIDKGTAGMFADTMESIGVLCKAARIAALSNDRHLLHFSLERLASMVCCAVGEIDPMLKMSEEVGNDPYDYEDDC